MGICSLGLKNEFETAMVNEPSVFEQLKFYCIYLFFYFFFFAVCHEHQFKDKYLFYRFREDDQGVSTVPSNMSKKECEDELQEIFLMLAQIGPDAMMRMILRKL